MGILVRYVLLSSSLGSSSSDLKSFDFPAVGHLYIFVIDYQQIHKSFPAWVSDLSVPFYDALESLGVSRNSDAVSYIWPDLLQQPYAPC